MTLRLALLSSPVSLEERYGVFSGAASTEPSFGLICLASAAQRAGAEVMILEASSENLPIDQTIYEILSFKPDIVGVTATTAGIAAAGKFAKTLKNKRPDVITLIGGCHVTALPEETMTVFHSFDVAVIGEGEDTLVDILRHIEKSNCIPQDISGTAIRIGSKIKVNPSRSLIDDLDSLPFPAWSLLRGFPEAFQPSPVRIKRIPCASVVLTRGCPNDCVFCDRSVFGRKCRAYSPDYAVNLLRDLRNNYGVKEILIEDDTFIISKKRVREFCERIIAENLDVTWSCLGRADSVDIELLKLMRKAGCWHISYGIESGDPDILEFMNKNLDIGQIRQAVQWSREAGLRTKGFFMIGFPKETCLSLKATCELAVSLSLDDITVMQLTPFPGSRLYQMADKYGKFERDWHRMNTLETVFVPYGFSKHDLEDARGKMLRKFYLRPKIVLRYFIHMIVNPAAAFRILKGIPAFFKIALRG